MTSKRKVYSAAYYNKNNELKLCGLPSEDQAVAVDYAEYLGVVNAANKVDFFVVTRVEEPWVKV